MMIRVTEYSQTVTMATGSSDEQERRGPLKVVSQTQGFVRLIAKNCHSLRQVESPPQLNQQRKGPAYTMPFGPRSSASLTANPAAAATADRSADDAARKHAAHDAAHTGALHHGIRGGWQHGSVGQLPMGELPQPQPKSSKGSTGHSFGAIQMAQQQGYQVQDGLRGGHGHPVPEVQPWSVSSTHAPQGADQQSQTQSAPPTVRRSSAFPGPDDLQNLNRDDVLGWLIAENLGDA